MKKNTDEEKLLAEIKKIKKDKNKQVKKDLTKFKSESNKINHKMKTYRESLANSKDNVVLPQINLLTEEAFAGLNEKDRKKYLNKVQKVRLSNFRKTTKSNKIYEKLPLEVRRMTESAKAAGKFVDKRMIKIKATNKVIEDTLKGKPTALKKLVRNTRGLDNKLKEIASHESEFGLLNDLTATYAGATKLKRGIDTISNLNLSNSLSQATHLLKSKNLINDKKYNLINKALSVGNKSILENVSDLLIKTVETVVPESRIALETLSAATKVLTKAIDKKEEDDDDELKPDNDNQNQKDEDDDQPEVSSWGEVLNEISNRLYEANNIERNEKIWVRFLSLLDGIVADDDKEAFASYLSKFVGDVIPSGYDWASETNNERISDTLEDVKKRIINRYYEYIKL